MQIINSRQVRPNVWRSPQGRFGSSDQELSIALGLDLSGPGSANHHPFDVSICRVEPGRAVCPYHAHAAQWEFYHVLEGTGSVRHRDGRSPIGPGDAFLFRPGEPHQILNDGPAELVLYVVADNPRSDACHYPDSDKWLIRSPMGDPILRSGPVDYLDGEE